jgi:tRNA(Ile)-lysidine synthase
MASSRKSSRSSRARAGPDPAERVAVHIRSIVKPTDCLLVGFSGGVDSVVLLDSLARLRRSLRFRLAALHVNHQLSPNAGRWSAFCKTFCRERGIPFKSVKVRVGRGESTEAAARAARYAAYAREPADYVVLAQHQDDQAETVLLQLLRGAGVKGLAAMPLLRDEGRGRRAEGKSKKGRQADSSSLIPHPSSLKILRPLLDVTRHEIVEHAKRRRLKWIEDESNADTYFLRNFLRHEVLPVIARRFPGYRATLARSAQHLAEASRVLDEVAAADARGQMEEGPLAVAALRRLPPARAKNLLRYFLARRGASMPGSEQLDEALRQALTAKADARVQVGVGDFELRRFEGRLHVVPKLGAPPAGYARRWQGERRMALPELGGVLHMAPARGSGVSTARLRAKPVTVRVRRGGERMQPDARRPRRSLKNLLQEARVPPWQRQRLPLVFSGAELAWVAGVGVDSAFQAAAGEDAVAPVWTMSG